MLDVQIYSKPQCGYCVRAKMTLDKLGVKYKEKILGPDFDREFMLETFPNARTFPQIVINGTNIGGYNELVKYIEDNNFNGTGYSL